VCSVLHTRMQIYRVETRRKVLLDKKEIGKVGEKIGVKIERKIAKAKEIVIFSIGGSKSILLDYGLRICRDKSNIFGIPD